MEKKKSKNIYEKAFIIQKNFNRAIYSIILVFILAFLIVIPKIHINGKEVVEIVFSTKYTEAGVKASFLGKDITKNIKIKSNIKENKIGTYEVTYYLDDFIIPISKKRIVKIIDKEKPKLSIKGDKTIYLCPGKEYVEDGFNAIDDYDGDITKKVKVTKEKDKIIYTVKDSSNNKKTITRKIIYKDNEKPNIQFNGLNEINIELGSNFQDPGYSAYDNCDGDITKKVEIIGNVDTNKEGTYTLTYVVTDLIGNKTKLERKINVYKNLTPNNGVQKPGVIYLTFDDGPKEGTTNIILDILKEENVKATFFVTNKGPDELIKRAAIEGHTVGLHTASHDYANIYSSTEAYFNDLLTVENRVKRVTGFDSKIIRFPGGSSNTVSRRYSKGIMSFLTNEVLRRGYRYYDWNISSGDAGSTTDPNQVYLNVISSLSHERPNIVLMHDIKTYTRDALKNIIRYGKDNGYTFEAITTDTEMVTQRVNN